MATVSDLNNTTLSGYNHIDALLDVGPDWNYMTPVGNTIQYTFSVTSGNEPGKTGQEAFTLAQQSYVRTAFDYISKLTGIQFTETAIGTNAQIHFANTDLQDNTTTGLCSWQSSYSYDQSTNEVVSYTANAWVYLDNVEWRAENRDLTPGTYGYETLLHELGHALGLKHPFEDSIQLPSTQDNTSNTLMSYHETGGPYDHFNQYDVAALNWIYGGDGLRGALGINSLTGARYITGTNVADTLTGTQYDDTLEGDGGNDMIYGGAGTDTAVFKGALSDYKISTLANGDLQVTSLSGTDGTDTLNSVEVLKFADGSYSRADVVDTTPPAAPTLTVAINANGYAAGNSPLVSGAAEANATIKLYSGTTLVGTTKADANGIWSVATSPFSDGLHYSVFATATDAAGNTSAASTSATFNIDATAPAIPTAAVVITQADNHPLFSGTGEIGTTIQLVRISDGTEIGRTVVGADGTWSVNFGQHPLPNGSYDVRAVSVDEADNATSSSNTMSFTIASSANMNGTAQADSFTPGAGDNAIDGGAGIDTAIYNSSRANFTVSKDVWGYTVADNAGGHDSLMNVERIHFADADVALDVDGVAGQAYRLYQAAFDRPAEAAGLGYWIWRMEGGTTLNQVAKEFMTGQPEFDALYGTSPTDADFVTHLYNNVLHRAAEGAGYDYWMNVLNTHGATREQVLAFFSESPENQAQVIGSIQGGMTFTPWHG